MRTDRVARSHAGADRNLHYSPDHPRGSLESPAHTRARIETETFGGIILSARSPAHTRARIETSLAMKGTAISSVARSHAGADRNGHVVDIACHDCSRPLTRGRGSKQDGKAWAVFGGVGRPLTRGRGSKPSCTRRPFRKAGVARSHAGADRNAEQPAKHLEEYRRPLTRGRGSKHARRDGAASPGRRPLTRGRGSKQHLSPSLPALRRVARSHAGADRNLRQPSARLRRLRRPLTRGRGSKPATLLRSRRTGSSPAHTRARIETTRRWMTATSATRSPAHTRARIETSIARP